MTEIIVSVGETIFDIAMNETGDYLNVDAILEANEFDTWTPLLAGGQVLVIPEEGITKPNVVRQLALYPVCNNANGNIDAQIKAIFDLLGNNWILATGFWNDAGIWMDNKHWNDTPPLNP